MIRLGKLTDYAVVVLVAMGHRPGHTHTVARLAEDTGVPAPTVSKVLKLLTSSTLTSARRGANGGYALARAAESITIADIVIALDGPIALTECVGGHDTACGVGGACSMRGNWDKINRAIRHALEDVTLADMMAPPEWARPYSSPSSARAVGTVSSL